MADVPNTTDHGVENDLRRRRLVVTLVIFEVIAISVCLFTAFTIATARGGSLLMALPLVLVSAAEIMRVTLSAWLVRVGWFAKALGVVVLIAISVGSGEGFVLAFEQAVQGRVQSVTDAGRRVARAQEAVDAEDKRASESQEDLKVARADVAQLDAAIAAQLAAAPQMPALSGKTCAGTKGRATTCAGDRVAQDTYRKALDEHQAQVARLRIDRKAAQERVDAGSSVAASDRESAISALREARRAYAAEAALSPMHRIAASVFGVEVGDVTPMQFETVKRWSVFGLAFAFATMSSVVGWVAFSDPVDPRQAGKLTRSLRAWVARRRKQVIALREVPGPERVVEVEKRVEVVREVPVEVVRIRYVPVDYRTGRDGIEEKEIVAADLHPLLRPVKGGK